MYRETAGQATCDHHDQCFYGLRVRATLVLIGLLVAKELSGVAVSEAGSSATFFWSFDRVLNVTLIPLLIVFAVIVVDKVIAVLH